MPTSRIGVVGGSGLYAMDELEEREEREISTPFGPPSDAYVLGTLRGVPVAFLSRHGRGHRLSPSELPFLANIYGFKSLGVDRLLSAGAVGSLREEIEPLDVSILSQRRLTSPYGLGGGSPGKPGRNSLRRAGSDHDEGLAPIAQFHAEPGDRLTIETPGGGGWGSP